MDSINQSEKTIDQPDQPDQATARKSSKLGLRATAAVGGPVLAHFVLEPFGVPHGTAERIGAGLAILSPALLAREIRIGTTYLIGTARNQYNRVLRRDKVE